MEGYILDNGLCHLGWETWALLGFFLLLSWNAGLTAGASAVIFSLESAWMWKPPQTVTEPGFLSDVGPSHWTAYLQTSCL